ncbi:bacillithiol biosynthesis cysteine-adding enzyme BshC [Sporosarcina thermotolerans]|uniref:Putative cysteine ligase BshC n=1 Tax=Sporosarcina thermotolerans TaxID=633404 RepID=A0AAW9A7N4_9BACL|nr:bacillithiol biosynthesis cysteine-adding enzyme BshC [Sporosarcina thermotolerans]MDW0115825.1 bacillithiol biosynthesis cysteine-adding enzyme BshC [Sporosarcina thermotolerans]WHT46942.1 bacillithiol biosynthesis cysteine-adding enzyme BshC [Sporosarcina thermotolerans]
MELESLELQNGNKVMQAYNHDEKFIHTFFDYKNESNSYPKRLKELSDRSFQRKELANVITSFMEPFGISEKAAKYIDELANDGVVVIGGQQAGIMTGPLYSVHKAITVILLAEKKREELGVPVIPVFWIAGEDHDLNEINHVYTEVSGKVTKNKYREKYILKLMASEAEYSHEMMTTFVKDTFRQFGETEHTKSLLDEVLEAVSLEKTFTGFFVRLMNGLFSEHGLLLIDSAYKPLREIEKGPFTGFIEAAEKIAKMIASTEEEFDAIGFGRPIQAEYDAANLFYMHETGRVLLTRDNEDFVNSSAGIRFTPDELMKVANEEPWLLSNNVATRPIMQDMVFPVLSFVGGPGEIAYWALLKDAFHHFGIKMPILVPRISITLVTPQAKQAMDDVALTVSDVLSGKVLDEREKFIETLHDEQFDELLRETETFLTSKYVELESVVDLSMTQLLHKNLEFHKKQLNYLRGKAEESLLLKHEVALRKYRILENELLPEGSLQERLFTPYTFMNQYGPELVRNLLCQPLKMDGTHQIVYL